MATFLKSRNQDLACYDRNKSFLCKKAEMHFIKHEDGEVEVTALQLLENHLQL